MDHLERGLPLFESPEMWRNDVAHIDFVVPAGTHLLQLITVDSVDLNHQDVANWCHVGFIMHAADLTV